MPRVIPYPDVLARLGAHGLRCNYHNSGAFAFTGSPHTLAWIGPADSSIRPAARAVTQQVEPPFIASLLRKFSAAWRQLLPGDLWLMPMSHWAFELTHAHAQWLVDALADLQLHPAPTNAADALEFGPEEAESFTALAGRLFENLKSSDYMIAFPGRPALCMLHHHQQFWWTTPDEQLVAHLRQIP